MARTRDTCALVDTQTCLAPDDCDERLVILPDSSILWSHFSSSATSALSDERHQSNACD